MEKIDFINGILKMIFINICIYKLYIKTTNYKDNDIGKSFIILVVSFIEAVSATILIKYTEPLIIIISIYLLHGVVISKITNSNYKYSIVITFIALTIIYTIYLISVIISGTVLRILYNSIQANNPLILILTILIEYEILHYIFKLKRLKNGFSFLQNESKVCNIGIVGFSFIGITVCTYSLLGGFKGRTFNTYLFTGIIIEFSCLFIWINSKITSYYKQKLKEKTIEELENEIKEKDNEINKILEENKAIAVINHKYSNRIKALEDFSSKITSKPEVIEKMRIEFGEDFVDFAKQIKTLSKEYIKEVQEKVNNENKLEKTGIFGIDSILEYMNTEAIQHNIKLNLKIYGSISYMIENIIEANRLETLLGDHIKDAIIAIDSSENTYRDILVEIGEIKGCYEVCIYDTGIEFEINTLLNLGLKEITTHKLTGGSGIGFMTTFETLKATKASLIIEEKHPISDKDYTKAIRIKFDGKHEYKICSYRAEEIPSKNSRIIIENLE